MSMHILSRDLIFLIFLIQWKFFNTLFNRCPADGGVGHSVAWRNQLQFTAVLLLYSSCDSCSHIKQCVHRSVFENIVLKLHLFTKQPDSQSDSSWFLFCFILFCTFFLHLVLFQLVRRVSLLILVSIFLSVQFTFIIFSISLNFIYKGLKVKVFPIHLFFVILVSFLSASDHLSVFFWHCKSYFSMSNNSSKCC